MKLPRDLGAADLEKALRQAFGYQFTRPSGSHRRLTTQTGGQHHLTVPAHNPLKPGTLRAILGEVAIHHHFDGGGPGSRPGCLSRKVAIRAGESGAAWVGCETKDWPYFGRVHQIHW